MWSKRDGFPERAYFEALDPRLADVVDTKMTRDIAVMGERAGGLTDEAAAWTGLRPGTAVAVANVDAHVAVPASTVIEPGRMVVIMGTSTCHMVLAPDEHLVPGICGYVEDGILPGFFGYEAGQTCVGDHFAWFVEHAVPARYTTRRASAASTSTSCCRTHASRLQPGRVRPAGARLVERQPVGPRRCRAQRPAHRRDARDDAPEIYRALVEATAYGTRVIIEAFEANGVPVNEVVAAAASPTRAR